MSTSKTFCDSSVCLQSDIKIMRPMYKLKDWVLQHKLDMDYLCLNPNAIQFLEDNFHLIEHYHYLSGNPNAIQFIERNPDKILWSQLSKNPNAIHILERNLDKIDWKKFVTNPNAIHIIENNMDIINCYYLWSDLAKNPNAIHIIENNMDKFAVHNLSENPSAIHIIENNLENIAWNWLSRNPNAIHILENNLDKINWCDLSENPNAIHIIENNLDKISCIYYNKPSMMSWRFLSANPNIFKYDYERMTYNIKQSGFAEELVKKVFSPQRLCNICLKYGIDFDELMDIY